VPKQTEQAKPTAAPQTPEPEIVPADALLSMLLDRIDAEYDRAVQEAVRAAAEIHGYDPETVRFHSGKRVWILPPAPEPAP
jgi:hypothetical protein